MWQKLPVIHKGMLILGMCVVTILGQVIKIRGPKIFPNIDEITLALLQSVPVALLFGYVIILAKKYRLDSGIK